MKSPKRAPIYLYHKSYSQGTCTYWDHKNLQKSYTDVIIFISVPKNVSMEKTVHSRNTNGLSRSKDKKNERVNVSYGENVKGFEGTIYPVINQCYS